MITSAQKKNKVFSNIYINKCLKLEKIMNEVCSSVYEFWYI